MRILVTGSSGQIGSYVVDELRERGHEPVGLDLEPSPGWTEIVGDIRDAEVVKDATEGCEAVVHCAAQISVQGSIEDPAFDASTNILGTINLLEAARIHDVERFVNVSSAAVYGEPEYLPIDEEHPTRPLSPYGQSKLAVEGYTNLYRRLHGLEAVCVRPFNVYSPRQASDNPYSGVITKFTHRILQKKSPIIYGDGEQTRDFVHARDVARWLVELARGGADIPGSEILNLGTGRSVTISELAGSLIELAGVRLEPTHEFLREGDIKHSRADATKARKLGLEPKIGLEEGLSGMLDPERGAAEEWSPA